MAKNTDKKKGRKAPSKANAKLPPVKRPKPSKAPQPESLVSLRTIHSLLKQQPAEMESVIATNSLSRALNAIQEVVMQDPDIIMWDPSDDCPKVIKKISRRLRAIAPEGYQLDWLPPLSAKQLKAILCDEASVAYIRTTLPGCLGQKSINSLLLITDLLLADE